MSPRHLIALALALSLACGGKSKPVPPPPPPPAPVALASLTEGQQTHGFTATAVYLDDTDQPMGARFVHQGTGFVFDYLRIESAPQGFIWVNSFPTSDQGEPHTQEHLLLGKGNRGRAFGSKQAMSLAESSAFTMQWRTCYHFHTVAGHDVFWDVFDDQLDALINPDYTDEEIRREVRNFGVSKNDDGTLRLEEKGTVYNEMVRSYEQPDRLLWEQAGHMVWGPRHPLAMSQGGEPAAIRTMTPDDIRTFHRDHYYLGNMGMIGAFPGSMELGDVLDHTGAILDRLAGRTGHAMTVADLPPAAGAAPGATAVVDYPSADATQASPMMLVWPATRDLDLTERTLMTLFLDAVAGDESTNLYGALVDGKTRTLDTGATAVWSYVSTDLGQPVYVGLEGVAAAHLTEADEAAVRKVVHDELARIAALPDDAPELKTLAARVSSRLTSQRRALAKFLNSPPAFGFRGTGSEWMGQLLDLERVDGFQKSLTLRPQLAAIEQVLAAGGNPWRSRLEAWGLLDAPYVVAARPSPELRITLDRERKDRATAELARLAKAAGTDDTAKVLRDFAAAYDAETAKLEQAARGQTMPPFIDSPPMTRDDELRYDQAELPGKVPLVTSRFDSMTSSTAGVAFRVDAVAEADLPYLAMLPTLLVDAGLFEDGQATPSEQVKEALRREVLGLSFGYDANPSTGRIELLARGAGNDLDESRRALTWMRRLLASPDWRRANLPRLRDAVAQQLTTLRKTMQGREEDWVEDPATAYWRQRWPQYLHTQSFLTQAHDVHRLRWMLADPGDAAVTAEVTRALRAAAAAGATLDRAHLGQLAAALAAPPAKPDKAIVRYLPVAAKTSAAARALLVDAGHDLAALLADLPDDALAADWAYLCKEMATDLEAGADAALAGLDRVRRAVFAAGNARAWMVGSTASTEVLRGELTTLVAGLDQAAPARPRYGDAATIDDRVRGRVPGATPRFVGLVNPSTSSGVFVNSAPGASFADDTDDALLDYLAGNLYTGHGGHSIFMKTWAAGLAYSNGLRPSVSLGRIRYYAERCPELPQTLSFVIGELRRAEVDPALADYAIAEAFSSRVAASYERRAQGIADDLADGVAPDTVRRFRDHLLRLRGRDGLGAELFRRMEGVYGKVLPGYGPASASVADAVYFVIGPDAQLDAWARYLATAEGDDGVLYRLYPRDFWVTAAVK